METSTTQLPSLYLITPEPTSLQDKSFFYLLEKCLNTGISLVQLRAKKLTKYDYCCCAEKAIKLCERYTAKLLVNATPVTAMMVGAHGVHLSSKRLLTYSKRPLSTQFWVAASCHQSVEIQQANLINTDFIVLGSVQTTASHPEGNILGWSKFQKLTKQAKCPVFALGGMTLKDIPKAQTYGAQGIAAIRALWK